MDGVFRTSSILAVEQIKQKNEGISDTSPDPRDDKPIQYYG